MKKTNTISVRKLAAALRGTALGLALVLPGLALAQDGVETVQYDDCTFYECELKDGVRHGKGTLRTPNGY